MNTGLQAVLHVRHQALRPAQTKQDFLECHSLMPSSQDTAMKLVYFLKNRFNTTLRNIKH